MCLLPDLQGSGETPGSSPEPDQTCKSFQCNLGTLPNPDNAGKTPADYSTCCVPTCGNTDVTSSRPVPFNCPAAWQVDPSKSNVTAKKLTAGRCCSRVGGLDVKLVKFGSKVIVGVDTKFRLTVRATKGDEKDVTAVVSLIDAMRIAGAIPAGGLLLLLLLPTPSMSDSTSNMHTCWLQLAATGRLQVPCLGCQANA